MARRKKGDVSAGGTDEVKSLNIELNSEEVLSSLAEMDGATEDLANSILKIGDTWKNSSKWQTETVDKAKEQSKVGKMMLNVIVNQQKGNKIAAGFAKMRLGIFRMLNKDVSTGTKKLFE